MLDFLETLWSGIVFVIVSYIHILLTVTPVVIAAALGYVWRDIHEMYQDRKWNWRTAQLDK